MKRVLILLVLPATFFLFSCMPWGSEPLSSEGPSIQEPGESKMVYDETSWKDLISDDCVAYFDGCNNCNRANGREFAACTRKYCVNYKEPRCLDLDE